MSQSIKALVKAEILVWARESAGLTVDMAAKKLGQKSDILEKWETGEKLPTFKQLIKISEVYKRPVPLFYLDKPPKEFKPLRDYRRLSSSLTLSQSPQLNFEIRKAYHRRQVALELIEEMQDKLDTISASIKIEDNTEIISKEIRTWLGIDNTEQTRWKNDREAFNGWRTALEDKGILVFQAERVEVSEMRGFAISDNPLPVIVVNKKDTYRGRIFSMLHELAHVLLGDSSISGETLIENHLTTYEQKVEVFCNQVAASILLPEIWFTSDELLLNLRNKSDWNDETVSYAAQRFNVSREFIWRRLLSIGFINSVTYGIKRQELSEEFKAMKEREAQDKKAIVVPHFRKILGSMGRLYSEIVLSSYHQGNITSSTLSEYMSMKLKHLPKIENALLKTAGQK